MILIDLLSHIKYYLNSGHDRSKRTKKNIFYSLFIKGVSIIISLILVPIILSYLDPLKYGIWITLSSIITWFNFLDIGFGNGLRNKFAEALAIGDHELAKIYVSTTYFILSVIITISLVIFLCINPFLNWSTILNAPIELKSELRTLTYFVVIFFSIQFVLKLINTLLIADQKPAINSFVNLIIHLSSFGVVYFLTKTTESSLIYIGISFTLTPVLILLMSSIYFYRKDYKEYIPSKKFIKLKYAKELMNLGLKFFIIQIAVIVMYQSSNIIIAQLFGPEEVTSYYIAHKYFGVVTMVFAIVIMPFWSAFTEAFTNNEFDWIRKMMSKLQKFWIMISFITIIFLLISDYVYDIWFGKQVSIDLKLSAVVALSVIVNSWNGIYSHFLNGVGKIKIQYYSAIWGMLLNIPLAIYLGKKLGIHGVISATIILGLINMTWTYIQYKKIINQKASGIWAR